MPNRIRDIERELCRKSCQHRDALVYLARLPKDDPDAPAVLNQIKDTMDQMDRLLEYWLIESRTAEKENAP